MRTSFKEIKFKVIDEDYARLEKAKGEMIWREFFLSLLDKKGRKK